MILQLCGEPVQGPAGKRCPRCPPHPAARPRLRDFPSGNGGSAGKPGQEPRPRREPRLRWYRRGCSSPRGTGGCLEGVEGTFGGICSPSALWPRRIGVRAPSPRAAPDARRYHSFARGVWGFFVWLVGFYFSSCPLVLPKPEGGISLQTKKGSGGGRRAPGWRQPPAPLLVPTAWPPGWHLGRLAAGPEYLLQIANDVFPHLAPPSARPHTGDII